MLILRGYIAQDKSYKVDDYPWGFKLRTSIFYWIETVKGKGDRFCSYTIDPKTGRHCKPKKSTYAPFMYLYKNEQDHVTYGVIDAYNEEKFEARFEFLISKIGVMYVYDDQRANIRANYIAHVAANAPYIAVKYSEEKKAGYIEWVKKKIKHIKTCEFQNLTEFAEPQPEMDNPEGEVKFFVTPHS